MTIFKNQSVGSFDDNSFEYVEVWYDETEVSGFYFHHVGTRDVVNAFHAVHGVTVEARYIFAAIDAFNNTPSSAVRPDGSKVWATVVWIGDKVTEIRLGDKWGKPVARMTRTGYVQANAA